MNKRPKRHIITIALQPATEQAFTTMATHTGLPTKQAVVHHMLLVLQKLYEHQLAGGTILLVSSDGKKEPLQLL